MNCVKIVTSWLLRCASPLNLSRWPRLHTSTCDYQQMQSVVYQISPMQNNLGYFQSWHLLCDVFGSHKGFWPQCKTSKEPLGPFLWRECAVATAEKCQQDIHPAAHTRLICFCTQQSKDREVDSPKQMIF